MCLHHILSITTIYISEGKGNITKLKRKRNKTENRQALQPNWGFFLGYLSQTFRIECNNK